MIVVGSPNSSNSQRLREVAEREGCRLVRLILRAEDIDWSFVRRHRQSRHHRRRIAPEVLVEEIIDAFAERSPVSVESVSTAERACSFRSRANCASRPRSSAWRSIRRFRDEELVSVPRLATTSATLLSYKGIAEGVENTNYSSTPRRAPTSSPSTRSGSARTDLPFFLGLMQHLAPAGPELPAAGRAIARRGARAGSAGRPPRSSRFSKASRSAARRAQHCAALGGALGEAPSRRPRLSPCTRPNALSLEAWQPLFAQAEAQADRVSTGLAERTRRELARSSAGWPTDLPAGIIHADLFTDNVFFIGSEVSGLIDFYFACTDALAYDVAICLNAWCFEIGRFVQSHEGAGMLAGYQAVRPLERIGGRCAADSLPRFGDALHADAAGRLAERPAGALVKPKDPLEYDRKLNFHRHAKHAARIRARGMSGSERGDDLHGRRLLGKSRARGWAAILSFKGSEKEISGGEAHTTNNRMEIARRHRGTESAQALLRRRSLHGFAICAPGHHALDAQLEATRLADRRQQAGEERGSLARTRRGRVPSRCAWHWVKGHADDPDQYPRR